MNVTIDGERSFEASPVDIGLLEAVFDSIKPYDDGERRTLESYGNRIMHIVLARDAHALTLDLLLDNYHQVGKDEHGNPQHEDSHIPIARLTHLYGTDDPEQRLEIVQTKGVVPSSVICEAHVLIPAMLRLTMQRNEYLAKLTTTKEEELAHV